MERIPMKLKCESADKSLMRTTGSSRRFITITWRYLVMSESAISSETPKFFKIVGKRSPTKKVTTAAY